MRRSRRNFLLLVLGIIAFIAFIGLVIFFPPSSTLPVFKDFSTQEKIQEIFSTNMLFFILLFGWITLISGFLLNNMRRGVLIGLLIVCFMLLRFFQLGQPFYIILLIAIVIGIEALFVYKK